jgi:hypothetical protein
MQSIEQQQLVVYDIQALNQKIIVDYIGARKTETNLAASIQRVMIDNLNRFSRQVKKSLKALQGMT